jgi:hypothetical protein
MCSAAVPLIRRHMTKSRSNLTLAGLIALAGFAPSQVSAQDPGLPNAGEATVRRDSLPFRAGQWGAEFAVENGTLGLGVLRFRSPRRAWLLDGAVTAHWSDFKSSIGDRTGTDVFVRVRVGPRKYRPVRTGIAGYVGMGLTGAYGWHGGDADRTHAWDAGVFGELGAAYFVTPHLSLGGRVDAFARYGEFRLRAPQGAWREREVSLGARPVRIVGALYF